jgi:hypothetical protein
LLEVAADGRQQGERLGRTSCRPSGSAPTPLCSGSLREQAVGELRSVRVFLSPGARDPEQRLHWRHRQQASGHNVMALGVVYEAMARWLGHAAAAQAMPHVFADRRRLTG